MWLFTEHHDCIFLKNFLSHPNIISQPISCEVGVCFLCIRNAERTCTHKLWESTTDQWSSFQCICFSSMQKVLLVQEGLIQIADQSPSWASLKKVCSLHTKNVAVRCPWSGVLLGRVLVRLSRNVSNQCGNHRFFIAPCMLHLCGPLLSGPRGWGGSVSKAMERAQHKFSTSLQKDPPHSNFPSDHCYSLKRIGRREKPVLLLHAETDDEIHLVRGEVEASTWTFTVWCKAQMKYIL